jgi:hypothetical protein
MCVLVFVAHVHHMLVVRTSMFGSVSLVFASMAAAVAMTTPLRRLRAKTKLEKPKRKPLLVVHDWAAFSARAAVAKCSWSLSRTQRIRIQNVAGSSLPLDRCGSSRSCSVCWTRARTPRTATARPVSEAHTCQVGSPHVAHVGAATPRVTKAAKT